MMKSISIPVSVLKAASLCCGVNDVRYYLQGVMISEQAIVTTDGNIMFKYTLVGSDEAQYIVHCDDLKILFKNLDKKTMHVDFVKLDDAYYFMSGEYKQFVPLIDGKYPDFNRVIDRAELGVLSSEGIKHIRMSHEYLALIGKITKALKIHKFDYPYFDFSTSTETCVISYETCKVKLYYMPCKSN